MPGEHGDDGDLIRMRWLSLLLPQETIQEVVPAKNQGFRLGLGSLFCASLTINLLSLAMPLMMLQTYDRIIPNGASATLHTLTIAVLIALTIEVSLRLMRAYLTNWAGASFEHHAASLAVKHCLNSHITAFESKPAGAYLQQMAAIGKLRDFYSGQAIMTLVDMPFILIFLFLIWLFAGSLVLVPVTLLTLFAFIAYRLGIQLRHALIAREERDDHRLNFLIETLGGIHTIKSLGMEPMFIRRDERLQAHTAPANYTLASLTMQAFSSGMLFSQLMMIMVASFGSMLVLNGHMSLGALAASILLSGRIMQPVQKALALWARMQGFQISQERLTKLLALPGHTPTVDHLPNAPLTLSLEDVSFHYDGGTPLFEHLSLTMETGDAVAIHGQDGTGRRTLLDLVAGLNSPDSGRVLLGGRPIEELTPLCLHRHIAYLQQKGSVFRGSIMENLTMFDDAREADARTIAQQLGLHETIALLPQGYDTEISDSPADPLPPGFRQRIAIARTLIDPPSLILFDNADRALDKHGYNLLFSMLGKLKSRCMMLIVSDDRNLLRLVDREYILHKGQLQPFDESRAEHRRYRTYGELVV